MIRVKRHKRLQKTWIDFALGPSGFWLCCPLFHIVVGTQGAYGESEEE